MFAWCNFSILICYITYVVAEEANEISYGWQVSEFSFAEWLVDRLHDIRG